MSDTVFQVCSTAVGICVRALNYPGLAHPVGVVYNTVDMVISYIALKAFRESVDGFEGFIASRIVGILAAAAVTTYLVGPLSVGAAVATSIFANVLGGGVALLFKKHKTINLVF